MAGKRQHVETTLQQPHEIHFSAADPDCRVYYGSLPGTSLNVVVVADILKGWVKTAYLARKKKQGIVEWSR
ncbi:MAG TPA: hypothetical protein VH253_06690 [Phycisphaerae bacterium]|nr:hypothetical protein [Phycisphaerae bacterium]